METLPLDWTRMCVCCPIPEDANKEDLSKSQKIAGKAIFCLPDDDNDWFQGYILTPHGSYGILAQKEEIDACLQCQEGGFRKLTLSFDYENRPIELKNVSCTGGDCMQWHSPHVSFTTNTIKVGSKAENIVETLFHSLLVKLRSYGEPNATVQDLMPNVAVVVGNIELAVPRD